MSIDLLFKIAAIGILVAVLYQVLVRAGREDQAMMTTLAGLVIVLTMVIKKQRFHSGEFAVDQCHAQLSLVIAVLPKSFDDDRRTDFRAIVGDQAGGRRHLHIGATALGERLADDLNTGFFGEHRRLRRVYGHHHMHFVEKARAALDDVQVAGGHWVVRPGANCNCHNLKRTAIG